MDMFEEEFKRLEPTIRRLCNFALLGKKLVVKGRENFIREGPNIIVGNHIGSFKDIAVLLKIVPRQVFFTANEMIFDKDEFKFLIKKHLQRHLKNFGAFIDLILTPIMSVIVNFISSNIGKVGTIPVDMYQRKKLAIEKCQQYLKKGRAIIALQGRGRVMNSEANPYISKFRAGSSVILYNLYKEEGISVPITPIAFLGTHTPLLVPAKIRVNVGEPMYISDYLGGGFSDTVDRFRDALEKRVRSLFGEFLAR